MKSYTNIEQSKKLAEFLPLESADMYYSKHSIENYYSPIPYIGDYSAMHNQIPCWSLAALLDHLRETDCFPNIEAGEHEVTMSVFYYDDEEVGIIHPVHDVRVKADTFVDACYKLILKLHEFKLL